MVQGEDSAKGNGSAAAPAMVDRPSTPSPSLERETIAGMLHGYLSAGFCDGCSRALKQRIEELASSGTFDAVRMPETVSRSSPSSYYSAQDSIFSSPSKSPSPAAISSGSPPTSPASSSTASDSDFVIRRGQAPARGPLSQAAAPAAEEDDLVEVERMGEERRMSWQQREKVRFSQVRRKKSFVLMEKVEGRMVNVLEGLELHTGVFNAKEQKKIVDCVYALQKLGEARMLRGRTYSRPKKWMRGKGRVTIQFGCCYNYAVDKDGNPPGIVQDEEVDPLPHLFKLMIKRMVRWHVLPHSCVPDSCIVNIYDEGDCIPPHIDHHDFLRPFCTVSFLSECNILFGSNLKVAGPGEFSGPTVIPLPVGSVLILNGNGADVAKHCVPGVPAKRISITFRKMDHSHLPYKFSSEPDLQDIQPLQFSPFISPEQQVSDRRQRVPEQQAVKAQHNENKSSLLQSKAKEQYSVNSFHLVHDDFPPLGSSISTGEASKLKRSA